MCANRERARRRCIRAAEAEVESLPLASILHDTSDLCLRSTQLDDQLFVVCRRQTVAVPPRTPVAFICQMTTAIYRKLASRLHACLQGPHCPLTCSCAGPGRVTFLSVCLPSYGIPVSKQLIIIILTFFSIWQ